MAAMISLFTKIIPHSWHRPFWIFAMMLMACPGITSGATDKDFAANELNRYARSKLGHLSNNQRQTINLLDRYQRQKQAQLRAKQLASPPASPASGNVPSSDSTEDNESLVLRSDHYQHEGPDPTSESRTDNDALVSYALTQKDCVQMVSNVDAKKLDKGAILKAQQQLAALGFYKDSVEGELGSRTRLALKLFCESAQFALSGDLLDMLQIQSAIQKVYPDWIQILASSDFVRWAVKQPDHDEISQSRQLGKSNEVIALLDRYKKRKTTITRTDDFHVSYSLTKDDFKQLQSTNEIFKLIEKLQGETYANKKEFDAALETAFKGVADPERYIQLVQKYAEPQTGLMLTEASFNNLKVKNTPDYILQSIQGLKGLNYPGTEINAAVENIINGLVDKTKEFKPEDIVKLAEISPTGIRFTDDSLKKFSEAQKKDEPLVPVILEKLQKMKVVEYQSSKTMTAAMKNVLKQIVDEINNSVPVIIGETEEIMGYSLNEESMQEINEQLRDFTVPDLYLDMLGYMQDVDYPDPDLFWLATKSRISVTGTNNILRQSILGVINKLRADKMDKVLLGKLREEKVPPTILAQLGTLQDRKFEDTQALENEIKKRVLQLNEQYDQYRPVIVAQARKKHPFDKTKTIQWSGDSCNCVHDHLAGIVYGFYPYWLAGEKQVIDFSVLTRIGYYGLGFDDKGSIIDASRWSELDSGFIREARSYNTKVDLVISRSDWNTWGQFSAEEKTVIFDNLATNIVGLVNTPLTNFTSSAKPIITLGTSPVPIMGDGVTLYFEGYPQDKESVDAFKEFSRTLRDLLKAQKRQYSVNIMFRSSEIGKGIYDYYKLKEFMDSIEGSDKNLDTNFIILLQEPTAVNKKQLRMNIENEMHAKDRVTMLRNTIITRTFDRNNDSQMVDDIVYAKDNFGGIGFWPQPFGVAGNVADNGISEALNKNYLDDVDVVESSLKPTVCHFICPNRWGFRIAWEIVAFTLLACVLLYFRKCEFRVLLDKHFIYVIAGIVTPFFLLSMALMYCDPFLAEFSKGHGFLMILVVALIVYSIWNHQDKKKKANLP